MNIQRLIAILLLCLVGLQPVLSQAQPATIPDTDQDPEQLASDVDAGQLQGLIDTLEDPERRAIFLERLNTLRALQQNPEEDEAPVDEIQVIANGLTATLMGVATRAIDSLTARLEGATAYISETPAALNAAYAAILDPDDRRVILEIVGKVIGTLIAALMAAWIMARLLARPWRHIQQRSADSMLNRILLMVVTLVLRLIPLAVFLAVAYLALPVLDPRPATRTVLLSLVYAHLIAQSIMVLGATLLAVDSPSHRPYRLADETAAYVYVWIRRITIVSVYGYFINQALLILGMNADAHSILVDTTGLLVALLFITLILQNRHAIARAIRGGDTVTGMAAQLRGTLALFWHLLAVVYIIGVYMVWATELEGGFTFLVWRTVITLAVILGARVAMIGAERGLQKLFHLPPRLRKQYPDLERRADRYRPLVTRILRFLLMVIAVLAIAQTWGMDAAGLFASEAGRALLARILRIALIIAAGLIIWEICAALIEHKLRAVDGNTRRMATVLPLIRNIVRLTIAAVGIMIVLSELGMNIGPLIASAGVIGLAIGFGAQTLVRDLISGMFVIFEDIIAVGDWVEIGTHTGIVESMHIRTMELRDLSGNIRVIPFGEVTSVHKVANDYSYAMIIIGVAYREDVEEVITLLREIGEEMQQDPDWKYIIREPLLVDGVNDMAASSIDIRLRIKCQPLEQWGLRREFLRRTKKLFDEKGIEIPFPHQTIYFGEDKNGQAPAAHVQLSEMAAATRRDEADNNHKKKTDDAITDNSRNDGPGSGTDIEQ